MTSSSDQALLDTNVLLYAYDTRSPNYQPCRELIERVAAGDVSAVITSQVLFEFFSVVTNPGRVRTARTIDEAAALVEQLASTLHVLQQPNDCIARTTKLMRTGQLGRTQIFDAVLASVALGNGINRIYTYDAGFAKIPGVTVLTP